MNGISLSCGSILNANDSYLQENSIPVYLSSSCLQDNRDQCPEKTIRIMKSQDSKMLEHLNAVLKNELTAINQYFLHAKMLDDQGIKELAEKERQESIEEMQHADKLMERILFLEGLPNLQDLGKLLIGESVQEMLQCDLDQEMSAIPVLREAIASAESASDYVSRDLFESILNDEEDHVDWLETQLELIGKTGIENYIQSKLG